MVCHRVAREGLVEKGPFERISEEVRQQAARTSPPRGVGCRGPQERPSQAYLRRSREPWGGVGRVKGRRTETGDGELGADRGSLGHCEDFGFLPATGGTEDFE